MFSDRITNIYSRYMDGSIIIPKAYGDHSNCSTIFGLPLTTNILMEIICNGLTSDSSEVSTENSQFNFKCSSKTIPIGYQIHGKHFIVDP